MFVTIVLCGISFVAGAGVVVVLSKNNRNTIERLRQDVLNAAKNGEVEINKVFDKVKGIRD